jgi:transcription initiation factor IIE alpha subunit
MLLETVKFTDDGIYGALRQAVFYGRTEIVKMLLGTGKVTDEGINWALWWAVEKDHTDIVEMLLETGKFTDEGIGVALDIAARIGNTEIVKMLLGTGKVTDDGINAALIRAAMSGNTQIVEMLLNDNRVTAEVINWALELAVEKDHTEIVKVLLETGKFTDEGINRALWWAVEKDRTEIAKMLLETGKFTDEGINRVLWWAVDRGRTEFVKMLLGTGKVADDGINAALRHAVFYGRTEIVKMLNFFGKGEPNDYGIRYMQEHPLPKSFIKKMTKDQVEELRKRVVKEFPELMDEDGVVRVVNPEHFTLAQNVAKLLNKDLHLDKHSVKILQPETLRHKDSGNNPATLIFAKNLDKSKYKKIVNAFKNRDLYYDASDIPPNERDLVYHDASRETGTRLGDANHWYEDTEMAAILNGRLQGLGRADVHGMDAIGLYNNNTEFNQVSAERIRTRMSGIQNDSNQTGPISLLIPININGNHWIGANVTMDGGVITVTFMDSFNIIKGNEEIRRQLEKLFEPAFPNRTNRTLQFRTREVAQQSNGNDCGPLTIENLIHSANNEVTAPDPKKVSNISNTREEHKKIYDGQQNGSQDPNLNQGSQRTGTNVQIDRPPKPNAEHPDRIEKMGNGEQSHVKKLGSNQDKKDTHVKNLDLSRSSSNSNGGFTK